MEKPKVFEIIRHTDSTGISGTGTVLWGVEFPDHTGAARWCSKGGVNSTNVYEKADDCIEIHVRKHPENHTDVIWYELTQIMPQAFFTDGDGI